MIRFGIDRDFIQSVETQRIRPDLTLTEDDISFTNKLLWNIPYQ